MIASTFMTHNAVLAAEDLGSFRKISNFGVPVFSLVWSRFFWRLPALGCSGH